MKILEVSEKGYRCIKCKNHMVHVSEGGLNIDINCSMLQSSIFLYREDIIKNCENYIDNEQYKRKIKLNKIIDKTDERNKSRLHKSSRNKRRKDGIG